jgi:hypothetical protein
MAGRASARISAASYVPGTAIAPDHVVGEVLDRHPELLATFLDLGFRPLASPVLRATVARHVSIGQACRQLGLNAEEVVATLNRVRAASPRALHALPMLSV